PYAGPGHWNDPDMLEVGNKGLSAVEARSHFSFWALLAAPLMAGNDPRGISKGTSGTPPHPEGSAGHQEPARRHGRQGWEDGAQEVWAKPLQDGSRAVILFNRAEEEAPVAVAFEDIGLARGGKANVRDLWKKADLGSSTGRYEAKVEPHGVVMVKLSPVP